MQFARYPVKKLDKNQIKLVSIILPTYNEAENIVPLIRMITKTVKNKHEIIVVDDNSPDGTSKIVQSFAKKNKKKNIKTLTRFKNRGLTNSLKDGIKLAKGDSLVWLDCDLSMPPPVISKLLKKVEAGYDIAVGSRFVKGGGFKIDKSQKHKDSPIAIILSRLMNFSIQILLGGNFRDYTSGFIAAKRKVFDKIILRGDYGEYFIDLIYKALAHKFKITEVGYICLPRQRGVSKTGQNLWQYLRRGIKYIGLTFELLIEKKILHKIP